MNNRVMPRAVAAALSLVAVEFAGAGPNEPSVGSPVAMHRTISFQAHGATLRDSLAAFEQVSGLALNPAWIDDRHTDGLDPERIIDLGARPRPALRVLELILQQADATATWQFDADGALEVGPRSRLNQHRTVRIYAVHDLLTTIPAYWDAPTIDLQAALQPRSSSPLREEGADRARTTDERPGRADELISLITSTIEPDQWTEGGGSSATIRLYHEALIVNAPGYIHRQLDGR